MPVKERQNKRRAYNPRVKEQQVANQARLNQSFYVRAGQTVRDNPLNKENKQIPFPNRHGHQLLINQRRVLHKDPVILQSILSRLKKGKIPDKKAEILRRNIGELHKHCQLLDLVE